MIESQSRLRRRLQWARFGLDKKVNES